MCVCVCHLHARVLGVCVCVRVQPWIKPSATRYIIFMTNFGSATARVIDRKEPRESERTMRWEKCPTCSHTHTHQQHGLSSAARDLCASHFHYFFLFGSFVVVANVLTHFLAESHDKRRQGRLGHKKIRPVRFGSIGLRPSTVVSYSVTGSRH